MMMTDIPSVMKRLILKTVRFSKLILCFILCTGFPESNAQQKDFQGWTSVQASLQMNKKLNINIEEEVRFRENLSQIDRQFNDLGIGYRFNKYLKTSVYYRVLTEWEYPGYNVWKQGLHGDIALRYSTGRVQFGYRARFMSSRINLKENNERIFGELMNRHKLSVDYDIKGLPLEPFIEGELFFVLQNGRNDLSNCRGWAGLKYSPGNTHEFRLKYGFDKEMMDKDPLTLYILSFSYSLNLKL